MRALGRKIAWVVGGAVFPSTGGIVLHTTDAGATWQIQPTPVDVTFRRASFVAPTPAITLKLSGLTGGTLKLGRRVTVKGAVTPGSRVGSKVKLSLQRKRANQWITIKTVRRTIGAGGAYHWMYRPAQRSYYRLRATIAQTATHTAATTTWRVFKVKKGAVRPTRSP